MSQRFFLKISAALVFMLISFLSGCTKNNMSKARTDAEIPGVNTESGKNSGAQDSDQISTGLPAGKEKFYINESENLFIEMIKIPGESFAAASTEITQAVYEAVTGENPSENYNSTPQCPADSVNWYDAVVFCNRLSLLLNRRPVYSVNGSINPDDWEYEAHGGSSITIGKVDFNKNADGFRLPTEKEWITLSGLNTRGSADKNSLEKELDKTAWYGKNSGSTPHETALKEPNCYGLYDTLGNVWEWVWDLFPSDKKYRMYKGGSCTSAPELCTPSFQGHHYPSRYSMNYSYWWFGVRPVMNLSE